MSPEACGTVYVVDDDGAVRKAIARLLESVGYTVRGFASAEAFLEAERGGSRPACVVLDVQMPGLSGQELHHRMRALEEMLPVVYITGHGDVPMGVRAMKEGAVDFLPKPVKADELLNAVERALTRAHVEARAQAETTAISERLDALTSRERQVLELVVRGYLNKQIAGELGVVEQTVKVHRGRVMRKMGAQSVADLVRVMERIGRVSNAPRQTNDGA